MRAVLLVVCFLVSVLLHLLLGNMQRYILHNSSRLRERYTINIGRVVVYDELSVRRKDGKVSFGVVVRRPSR